MQIPSNKRATAQCRYWYLRSKDLPRWRFRARARARERAELWGLIARLTH